MAHDDSDHLSEEEKLDRDIANLENKIRVMREMIGKQESYTSPSYDARKLYGDILPGDKTHEDVIRLYQHHFNMAFQHMPKKFEGKSKFEVWQMCGEIFQDCFDEKRKTLIKIMKDEMKIAVSQSMTIADLDEKTTDLHRAFKIMIAEVNDQELLLKMKQRNPSLNEDAFYFVLDMIQKLKPVHYRSFLTKGTLNETKLELLPEI
ncbi:PREDICTED: uncharacterized protein LOC109582096 [Amphimedon queenslandica]|nr:PREDICTED: uncharacterized protein LOC109582096 [Amphimedon queenslandica]|eukprot:XP_019852253.1 PREDICTED: uncharacterized protein LOC109582096 [Amphimedon queenslandica]